MNERRPDSGRSVLVVLKQRSPGRETRSQSGLIAVPLASLQLTGVLDDCFCDVESIDVFNNFKIYPRVKALTERDYFRYYRVRGAWSQGTHVAGAASMGPDSLTRALFFLQVNLKRPCPFWPDDGHCSIKDCHVEPCPEVRGQLGFNGLSSDSGFVSCLFVGFCFAE